MSRNGGILSGGFNGLRAPSAPAITGVTTSIGSASVAFTAPTDVGDAAVSSYVVTAVDESSGASTGATGSASPITVTPPAGGTFKIRMQALNAYGPGRLTEYDTGNVIYAGAELYAWGKQDSWGQLGDNTVINKSSPVQIGVLTNWTQVAGGADHSLAINSDGRLYAWGLNNNGQLGDGTVVAKSSPVQVGALTNWSQSAGSKGSDHSAAVKTDGTLWAWGANTAGQLGDNTVAAKSSPIQVGALTVWAIVGCGFSHTTALKTDGTIWAWGNNSSGQIGDNTTISKSSPVQIGALTNWFRLSAARANIFAVKNDGTLWGWGFNGADGRLGINIANSDRSSPVQIGALTNWSQPVGGFNQFNGAVKTDGTLWTWGGNASGQLGDGTVVNKSSPIQVGVLTNWKQAEAGSSHTVSVKTDGTLWTWGGNASGQLGDNTVASRSSPVQIGALNNWWQVSAGENHTLALYGVV